MKLEFSQQIFEENLKYQILSRSVHWDQSCSMWMDGHDKTNSRFLQFCKRAYKVALGSGNPMCYQPPLKQGQQKLI
jgi:hypothetical protein